MQILCNKLHYDKDSLEVKEKSLQTQEPYFVNQACLHTIHVFLMFQKQPLHKIHIIELGSANRNHN